jgi:hypothetical protein
MGRGDDDIAGGSWLEQLHENILIGNLDGHK